VSSTVPYGWHLLPADETSIKPYWLCPKCWAVRRAEESAARPNVLQSGIIASPLKDPNRR
jgi:hypothetical protein